MEQRPSTNQSLQYQDLLLDRTLTQDITKDLSLPDYQPEIKRLLRVSATVQPPTRYIGGGNIEFSGNVDFLILYSGEDGALYSFPVSSEYVMRTTADSESALSYLPDENMTCYATIDADMVNGRVGGPRKLTVRCRMRARVRAYGSQTPTENWNGQLCGTPQRLQDEVSLSRVLVGTSAPLLLRDEILPDRTFGGNELRIVSAQGQVLPEEVTTSADRVNCRGQFCLKLLLQQEIGVNEDNAVQPMPYILQRNLPFTVEIPVQGLLPGGEAIVLGSCTELSLVLEDDKILCEAELILEARTQHRELHQYTADLCCIGQHSEVSTATQHGSTPVRCLHVNLSLHETLLAKDHGLPPSAYPIDVCATVLPDSLSSSTEGTRYLISGTIRYSLLYHAEGEYASRELDLPFRCYADLGSTVRQSTQERQADYTLHVAAARARYDERDGKLSMDAELCLALRVWEPIAFSPISEIKLGEPHSLSNASRTIYYPMPGESLWSVAKRYCSSVEQLCSNNRITTSLRADDPKSLLGMHTVVI